MAPTIPRFPRGPELHYHIELQYNCYSFGLFHHCTALHCTALHCTALLVDYPISITLVNSKAVRTLLYNTVITDIDSSKLIRVFLISLKGMYHYLDQRLAPGHWASATTPFLALWVKRGLSLITFIFLLGRPTKRREGGN